MGKGQRPASTLRISPPEAAEGSRTDARVRAFEAQAGTLSDGGRSTSSGKPLGTWYHRGRHVCSAGPLPGRSGVVNTLDTLWFLVGQVLRLQTGATELLARLEGGGRLALLIVVLAGFSEAVGESVVLFINRVSPRRFLLSLLLSAGIFAFTYVFWVLSVFAVARLAFGATASFGLVARVVGFAYAPRLFGFLAFIPFFGLPLLVALHLWSSVAALLGVATVFELTPWQALACVLLGELVLLTLQRTIGRPLTDLARWLRRRAAGSELVTDLEDLRSVVEAGPEAGLPPAPDRPQVRDGGRQ